MHEVKQFIGLCNFFRSHVKNFAQIGSPLLKLTSKETHWKGGHLPPDCFAAYSSLKQALCSEAVMDNPRKNRPYSLIMDASIGNDKTPGGLGAILCQTDEKGKNRVIAYTSRQFIKHEKNYTPFLVKMQAIV